MRKSETSIIMNLCDFEYVVKMKFLNFISEDNLLIYAIMFLTFILILTLKMEVRTRIWKAYDKTKTDFML